MEKVQHAFPCTWTLRCSSCGRQCSLESDVSMIMTPEYRELLESGDPAALRLHQMRIDTTGEPSRIVDLSQWLDLVQMWQDRLRSMEGPPSSADTRARLIAEYQLVQCLAEAIKFYETGRDKPPDSAFFVGTPTPPPPSRDGGSRFSLARLRSLDIPGRRGVRRARVRPHVCVCAGETKVVFLPDSPG